VTISVRQRELLPELAPATVIHHGIGSHRYRLGHGRGRYAAFLGRFAVTKGVHVAIDVAQAAGVRLRLAGRPHWCDHEYHERQVRPRLAQRGIEHVGEVGGSEKLRFLGEASALLFPIAWEEPFGLVMVEAMLCGTPVLGFPRGSVPEVIDHGVTGFLCDDAAEMAWRLRELTVGGFDRRRCRARAVERWSAVRMVREHLALYRQAVAACSLDPPLEQDARAGTAH
jgi:glycosyltransferase involved in cell wall biosynthesis